MKTKKKRLDLSDLQLRVTCVFVLAIERERVTQHARVRSDHSGETPSSPTGTLSLEIRAMSQLQRERCVAVSPAV